MLMKIYHYTSLEALTKILAKDCISLRATRYDSMNDPLDFKFARDIIIPKLRIALQNSELAEDEKEYVEQYPYIVSFSKIEDDFNMWRMYKGEVAIEFDSDKIVKSISNNMHFSDCIYVDETDIDETFTTLFNESIQSNKPLCDVQDLIARFKLKEFQNENEIRLYNFSHKLFRFTFKENDEPDFIDCETSDLKVDVKCIRNKDLVLYQEFNLPKDIVTGITIYIHDNEHFNSVMKHLQIILNERDYNKQVIDNIKQTKTVQFNHL